MRALRCAAILLLAACEPRSAAPVAKSAPAASASVVTSPTLSSAPPASTAAAADEPAPATPKREDECRDSSACKAPARCCASGVTEVNECNTTCHTHEACVPGAPNTCRHPGAYCSSDYLSHSGGTCRVQAPSVACGGRRCRGDKPACRWNSETRTARCVAQGFVPEETETVLDNSAYMECASPRDCAGERCCASGPVPMAACDGACTSGIEVCDTLADCSFFIGPPIACRAHPKGPPFLKTCRYAGGEPD